MEKKNLDITNPRYDEPISLVPWHFVKSRFHFELEASKKEGIESNR